MNPFTILPAKYRRIVYALVAAIALVWGCWEAAGGDWKAFVAGLIVAVTHSVATANTDPTGK